MAHFGHHHHDNARVDPAAGIPGLAGLAAAQGWHPAPERPFDGHLEDAVHEISRVMYGVPRTVAGESGVRVGGTVFTDAYRGAVDGRTVVVANAWTAIGPELRSAPAQQRGTAVVAVELPTILPLACIQPRRLHAVSHMRFADTGHPDFDARFAVASVPNRVSDLLTAEVRQRIMVRDDWVFWGERYLFAGIVKPAFHSADEVGRLLGEVLAVVHAFPAELIPAQVDHSQDELMARINALQDLPGAVALLEQLTPDERVRLARSNTPLAGFADVRTPQEAMARFQSLDPQRKMQIMAMFMWVDDARRGR